MFETVGHDKHAQISATSSEDAVRYNKASLSVEAAFSAEGFGGAPAGLMAMVADYVNRQTRDIPASKLANMSPGSGNLGSAATAGVNLVIGSLTPDQRSVLRAGGNPLNPADMAAIGAKLGLAAYAMIANKGDANTSSGGRYAAMRDGIAGKDSPAMAQYTASLGRMSGNEYASRLGFTGDQAREFGQIMQGTTGGFRKSVEDYKKAIDDPNATPEQKAEAQKKMKDSAKGNKANEKALPKVQEMFEKLNRPDLAKPNQVSSSTQQASGPADKKADQAAIFQAMKKQQASQAPKGP